MAESILMRKGSSSVSKALEIISDYTRITQSSGSAERRIAVTVPLPFNEAVIFMSSDSSATGRGLSYYRNGNLSNILGNSIIEVEETSVSIIFRVERPSQGSIHMIIAYK